MTWKKLSLFLMGITVFGIAGPAYAADVLFVDSETPDASWQTLIESGGHTYTLFDGSTYSFSLGNQASIDYVNGFDLLVVSGSNPVFNSVRTHGATWNTQPTPMITMGNYLCSGQFSSASWRWTVTTSKASNASGDVDVLDGADPVWDGVTVTPGTPDTADLFSGNVGHLNLNGQSLLPGITVVAAQSSNSDMISVAHADPNALRAGSQEQYFIAGMTGGSGNPVNFSAEGELVFLNAIAALTGGGGPDITLGDTNGDDVVDATDYLAVKTNLPTGSGATLAQGDVDEDGDVDWADLNLLATEIDAVAAAVPEPATMGLLALGALALVRRRRK